MGEPQVQTTRTIPIQGGIPPEAVSGLADFVKTHYLDVNLGSIANRSYQESRSDSGAEVELSWTFSPQRSALARGPPIELPVRLKIAQDSATVSFPNLSSSDAEAALLSQRVGDDIEVLLSSYVTHARSSSLYFIFSPDQPNTIRDAPPSESASRAAVRKIFAGNMTNLYLIIMALSFGLFLILGNVAIFAVLGIQLLALFFSDRMALSVGKVHPSEAAPEVTMVCVPVSPETKQMVTKYVKNIVATTQEELEKNLPAGAHDDSQAKTIVSEVLAKSGIKSPPDEIKIVTRNVYDIVKGVADRFKLPVPKIVIMNTIADNAAATGVSSHHASIAITAGSLEDLDDRELSSVIGHEFGHIKGHDPLILFATTTLLYVGGLYVWYPLLLYLGLVYYLLIFAIIYAVGKVLETRADTESVANLGQPDVMGAALSNIGFRQLYHERYSPGAKFFDWLTFDPHPPIYFRIQRLSKYADGSSIKHATLDSLRDCLVGFLSSI